MSTTIRTSAPAEADNPAAGSPRWPAHAEGAPGRPLRVAIHPRWWIVLGATAVLAVPGAWAMGPFVPAPPMPADDLPLLALVAGFGAAAAVVWIAGIRLSDTTDVLSTRLGLGEALGGLLLLAVATNLPEVAIVASAAMGGDLGLAIGNILGGIAIQTVALVALDRFGLGAHIGLTYRAASLVLVLEGVLVIAVLILAIMATRLPASLVVFRIAPGDVAIVALWLVGVWLIGRARRGLPWHDPHGTAPDGQQHRMGMAAQMKEAAARESGMSTAHAAIVFTLAAVATLAAGVVLEVTGDAIAQHIGLSGVLFGATLLAAATALPEISTGLGSVRLGDYQLAVSDIFGGNAFLPVLFLLATVLAGRSVLPLAQDTDIYLAGLGILLTAVYITGLIFRPRRQVLGMGVDSLAVLALYGMGIAGLVLVAGGT
jgi:cation:H+ antiporter